MNKIDEIKENISQFSGSHFWKFCIYKKLDELRPSLKSETDKLKIDLADKLIEIYNEHGSDVIKDEDKTDPELATIYFRIKELTKGKEQGESKEDRESERPPITRDTTDPRNSHFYK